jgi:glycosyltransferase involved in cell wall biosynthesis
MNFRTVLTVSLEKTVETLVQLIDWVRGWASIFIAVLFMGGIQLLSLGVMGEYIGRIYGEVKQRPLYLVREERGFRKIIAVEPVTDSKTSDLESV